MFRRGTLFCLIRPFSTQPAWEGSPGLKVGLRELYKKVHPDLFQDIPAAKEANEHSFKLLQEYLAAAKHGGGIGRTAGLPYRFTFYVRPSGWAPEASAATAAAAEGGLTDEGGRDDDAEAVLAALTRVAMTLPPPSGSGPGDELSAATRKAFSRLLSACGVSEGLDPGTRRATSRLLSLREFVPAAAEAVRQAAAQQGGPRHEVGAVRAALRLARGVTVAMGGHLAGAGALEQLAQLRQLSRLLDDLPALDLSGLKLGLGEGYGTDALGTVWLHAGAPPDAWARFLPAVDLAFCRSRHELAARVRAQEGAVARALGVALLHAHPQLSLDPPYMQFLERAAAAAAAAAAAGAARGVGSGALREVSVRVEPDAAEALGAEPLAACRDGGDGDGSGACAVDAATGTVSVPMSLSGGGLLRALARLGPPAAAAAAARRQADAELARLRSQVERKLRLRRLARAPGVAPDRFRACCLRLLHHAAEVGPLLDGLEVRVAEVNGLPADRSCVDIAWDWRL